MWNEERVTFKLRPRGGAGAGASHAELRAEHWKKKKHVQKSPGVRMSPTC